MLQGATQLNAKLVQLEKRFDGIAKQVAAESVGDVEKAVRGDIGDASMSGWRRGSPIPVVGAFKVVSPSQVEIVPKGRSAGPARVLESGRNANGGAGGFQGPGINFRTGNTSARARATGRGGSTKGRRWNGRTQGKGTWSDAEQLVQQGLGRRASDALHQAMVRTFTKG